VYTGQNDHQIPTRKYQGTRLEKEWSTAANNPAKSNMTLILMKMKFWTPFTQCFHIMKEAIKIFKHHYDLHPEYILGLQSEQSLGSPSILLPNHTAPNWQAPCSTHTHPYLHDKNYIYSHDLLLPHSHSEHCNHHVRLKLCSGYAYFQLGFQTYSYISETICKHLIFMIFFYVLLVLSSQKNPALRICLVCVSIQLSVHCIMHSAANIARHTNTM